MPKIIENIRENLLEEARRQVMEEGYASMTIRSVAGACGVGVGTVYNYFSSKDMLVAEFMLTDWQKGIDRIKVCCQEQEGLLVDVASDKALVQRAADRVFCSIYDELRCFMDKYAALFRDESAGVTFASAFPQRHKQLRDQIAEPVQALCKAQINASPEFLADFIAESMLTWTLDGRSYKEISSLLLRLF